MSLLISECDIII